MERPSPTDFFKQFDDVEVRELSEQEIRSLRKMATFKHNEFVRAMGNTFDTLAIDAISVLFYDAIKSPNSKTNLNMMIRMVTRLIGIKHLFYHLLDDDNVLDPPGFDLDEVRIELLKRVAEFRKEGK